MVLAVARATIVRASITQQDSTYLEEKLKPEYHASTYRPCVDEAIYQYPLELNEAIQWSCMTLSDRDA